MCVPAIVMFGREVLGKDRRADLFDIIKDTRLHSSSLNIQLAYGGGLKMQ